MEARPRRNSPKVNTSILLAPFRGTRSIFSSTFGRRSLLFVTALLRHAGSVFGLRVLHPRRLAASAGILAGGPTRRPVLGARLLFRLLGSSPARDGTALGDNTTFFGFACFVLGRLARRFWEV